MDNTKNNDEERLKEMLDKEREHIEQMKKSLDDLEKKKRRRVAVLLNYISILIAITAGIISSVLSFGDLFKPSKTTPTEIICDTTEAFKRISELEKSYSQLSTKLNSVIIINKDSLKQNNFENVALAQLKSQVTELNASVKNLEKVILDNPEKAISIPLLKQQLENQKDQNEKEFKYTKDEIARVYDINKWIIGLVFGMLVSIIVLNISNLLSKNKKE
jgi:tetrahydromethanopterin S-methyltransferase subunit G